VSATRSPSPFGRAIALAAAALLLSPAASTASAAPRTSLPAVEQQVMCVTCGIPLAEADSPQADRERAFIRTLIARGETTAQIKRALVAQYGPTVLALPKGSGFDLTVYVVPAAVVVAIAVLLAAALPRWRRRARQPPALAAPLSAADEARLEEDLARYEP
jgi:cytochrome c-type biogenesis protein CcmH